jgi:hypothetical protein
MKLLLTNKFQWKSRESYANLLESRESYANLLESCESFANLLELMRISCESFAILVIFDKNACMSYPSSFIYLERFRNIILLQIQKTNRTS